MFEMIPRDYAPIIPGPPLWGGGVRFPPFPIGCPLIRKMRMTQAVSLHFYQGYQSPIDRQMQERVIRRIKQELIENLPLLEGWTDNLRRNRKDRR